MNISLIDLSMQYQQIKIEVENKVKDVMQSTNYIMGKEVGRFEESMAEFLGVKHAIGVANGTDALVLSLCSMGIKKGDEVITTPFTFFASAESISRVGAMPVFVDIDKDTLNIDVDKIEEKITKRTKAILLVHIFGNACDMNAIHNIANRNNLFVIEDACQAIGGKYKGKRLGSLSDVACFSFFPTKNLGGMGDGGLVVTDNDKIASIVKALKNHGSGIEGKHASEFLNGILQNDYEIMEGFEKYYNYLIGYNSRLDEIQAAILNVKLKYIDEWNERRRKLALKYTQVLDGNYILQKKSYEAEHVYHMFSVQSYERDKIVDKLNEKGIATGIYYPVPLHLQKVFGFLGYKKNDLPIVEEICNNVFAIPIFPELRDDEQKYIIDAMLEGYK